MSIRLLIEREKGRTCDGCSVHGEVLLYTFGYGKDKRIRLCGPCGKRTGELTGWILGDGGDSVETT